MRRFSRDIASELDWTEGVIQALEAQLHWQRKRLKSLRHLLESQNALALRRGDNLVLKIARFSPDLPLMVDHTFSYANRNTGRPNRPLLVFPRGAVPAKIRTHLTKVEGRVRRDDVVADLAAAHGLEPNTRGHMLLADRVSKALHNMTRAGELRVERDPMGGKCWALVSAERAGGEATQATA